MNQLRQLTNLDREIERWGNDGKDTEMKRSRQEVERLETEKLALEQRKKEIQQKASKLQLALSNCENEERNLRNNLKLILNTTERQVVRQELEHLNDTLEKFKLQQLVQDIKGIEAKLERCKARASFNC